MKIFKALTAYSFIIYLLCLFSSCGSIEGIEINMEVPAVVKENEEFITQVKITNTLDDPQTLVSIDVGDGYLEGVSLVKTEPGFTESMHVPIDNSVSYSFKKEIGPQESITIDLHWKATSEGKFSDYIDFCINSEINFIEKYFSTVVKNEFANTNTEITSIQSDSNSQPKKESKTNNKANTELIRVDAVSISKEIGDNEIAAELKYMEKEIIVTNCTVLGTEKDYDGYFVKVRNLDEWEVSDHEFYFNKDQLEKLSQLKKGQVINVRGVVSKFRQWGDSGELIMTDCEIVK
jgi:hypothetical protein